MTLAPGFEVGRKAIQSAAGLKRSGRAAENCAAKKNIPATLSGGVSH